MLEIMGAMPLRTAPGLRRWTPMGDETSISQSP